MVAIGKLTGSLVREGRRLITAIIYGKDGVRDSYECSPFGIDSNPYKGIKTVYSTTTNSGEQVNIGYINENVRAAVGETYIYSTNTSGALSFTIKIKNDGTCEMGGNADNAVRYTPLNTGLQNELTAINANFATIATALSITLPTVTLNISASKINEIKTL